MESIEHDADVVVVAERVALEHVGANEIGMAVAAEEGDEEIVVGVAEVSSGAIAGRGAVIGVALDEAGDAEHSGGGEVQPAEEVAEGWPGAQARNDERSGRALDHRE